MAESALDFGNMTDTDACTVACKVAKCGDGSVQDGVEACDDGNMTDTDACTNACKAAACGDGIVQAGVEECDDGNMTDTDSCTNVCKKAACGDGIVQAGVEACDDGNSSNTDACVAGCKNATCGDGFIRAGVEACDDGDMDDTNTCTNACKPSADARLVFVTSKEYTVTGVNGFVGVAGANTRCQEEATGAGLTGTWAAWITDGDPMNAPDKRLFQAPDGYLRTDGVIVANTWADLTDNSLDAPINRYPNGMAADANTEDQAWTNPASNCWRNSMTSHRNNWTMNAQNMTVRRGLWTAMDAKWSDDADGGCSSNKRLLCFQQ